MASKRECDNCHARVTLNAVTVRMYMKRLQVEYRYNLCADDVQLLETLLAGTANSVQRGLFDHRQGMTQPAGH